MKFIIVALAAAAAVPVGRPAAHTDAIRGEQGWQTLTTDPYPGKRDDIAFSDETHGWYGTGKGDLFATSDGGRSWAKVASRPGTFIRAIGFVDARTGFIGNIGTGYYPGVTDRTPLYRTDDGGATWSAVDLGGAKVEGICAIDILRTDRIFQGHLVPAVVVTAAGRVGGPAAMIRSTDGGASWKTIDMSRWTSMILDVHFVDERTGFVAGASSTDVKESNAQILMTRDGGASWVEVYRSRRPSELVWKMNWPTRKAGFATIMSYDRTNLHKVVVKSEDGGRQWTELPLVEDGKAVELGIGFVSPAIGWVGTTVGGFETRDGGRTFSPSPIAPAANKFRMVPQKIGGVAVYAIGTQVQRRVIR